MTLPVNIEHNTEQQRFAITVEGLLCVCDYHVSAGVATFTRTVVPPALAGRGLAAALVEAALAWARQERLKVRPACSYVAVYMRRHPQTLDLMA